MIQAMMSLDKDQRPSVEDIMPHPKVSQHLKEQSMRDMIHSSQRKEEELKKKDKMIKQKELDLDVKLKEIDAKEKLLKEWEEKLVAR